MRARSTAATATPVSVVSLPRLTLILGGARSGKSAYAEALIESALRRGARALYLATGEAGDGEMAERIRGHRARRDGRWVTREAPLDLAAALIDAASDGRPVLLDCLTLWVSNLLGAGRDVRRETARLIAALRRARGPVVVVSNEVGLGLVPDNALARAYRDHLGRLNQEVAAAADRVLFMAAGLPLVLKDRPTTPRRR
jgi:adenosylcobinamide kinase/adenosylcobinamide-phosphate guanylyltransferase